MHLSNTFRRGPTAPEALFVEGSQVHCRGRIDQLRRVAGGQKVCVSASLEASRFRFIFQLFASSLTDSGCSFFRLKERLLLKSTVNFYSEVQRLLNIILVVQRNGMYLLVKKYHVSMVLLSMYFIYLY